MLNKINRISLLLLLHFILFFNIMVIAQNNTKIRGRIIDQNGKPISGVKLIYEYSTTPDGLFSITTIGIPSNQELKITVIKNGYYLSQPFGELNLVTIKASERNKFLIIKLHRIPYTNERKRIAVLPFCNHSIYNQPLIDGAFTARASQILSQVNETKLVAIPSVQVWNNIQKSGLNYNAYCDYEKILKLGDEMNANIIVIGAFTRITESMWEVQCTFLDVTKNDPLFTVSDTDSDLFKLQEKMYLSILKRLGIRTESKEEKKIMHFTGKSTNNEDAYMHYLNGSHYELVNDVESAIQELLA